MPAKVIDVPGLGNVEFPDTMSDEEIAGHIQKQVGTKSTARQFLDAGANLMSGIGGGGFTSLKGITTLAERGANMGTPGGPIARAWESPVGQRLTANRPGIMEGAGRVGEQLGELLIPGPAEAKTAAKLEAVLPRGLRTLGKAGLSAGTTGMISAIQSGGKPEEGVTPAMWAAGTTLLGGALSKPLAALGRKIQMSTIRPRQVDLKDGFDWKVLDRFKLKGNLEQSFQQVDAELNRLRTARNNLIKPGTANVDAHQAFESAMAEIKQQAASGKYGHADADAIKMLEEWRAKLAEGMGHHDLKGVPVDISRVEGWKEFYGDLGAWASGSRDPNANLQERLANVLYSKLRQSIENALGPQGAEVKALNKQMQDLIPVKHAMMARIPVEQRNRLFSLQDFVSTMPAIATGDAKKLALLGWSLLQKNLRAGNWMNRTGVPQGAGRAVGGAVKIASPWIIPPMPGQ